MTRPITYLADKQEEAGGPHWLSPKGRANPNRQRDVHRKHREMHLARKRAEREQANALDRSRREGSHGEG